MTQESLQAMSVEQLRDHARKNTNLKKTAIVFMKRPPFSYASLKGLLTYAPEALMYPISDDREVCDVTDCGMNRMFKPNR